MRQIQARRFIHSRSSSSSDSEPEFLDPKLFSIEKKASNFRQTIVDSSKLLELQTRTQFEEKLLRAENVYRTALSRTAEYKEKLMIYVPTQIGSIRLCRLWVYLYPLIFDALVDNMVYEPLHPEKKDCVDQCKCCFACYLKWASQKLGCPITDIWLSGRGTLHSTGYYAPQWSEFSVKQVLKMLDFYVHYREIETYMETQLNWLIKQYRIHCGKKFMPFKMALKCSTDETGMKVKQDKQSFEQLLYGGKIADYLEQKMNSEGWTELDCQIQTYFFEQAKKKNQIISRFKLDEFLSYQRPFHNVIEKVIERVVKIEQPSIEPSIEQCIHQIKQEEREIMVDMYHCSEALIKQEEENMMIAQDFEPVDYE